MDNKDIVCADIEKKEKMWKRTSIILAIVIVIFCVLVVYGYTITMSYKD